jgi:CheY-like chemotaxis protein
MIIAAVDDLMFVSKISTAARQLGVDVRFVKTSDELTSLAMERPSLVIFDLNNQRTNALEAVGAIKSNAALASIPTVGFVSHVQGDVIADARRAGVDEVMARSAFVDRLPELLARDARR